MVRCDVKIRNNGQLYKNIVVDLLEKLLKDNIPANTFSNLVAENKYSDRLKKPTQV